MVILKYGGGYGGFGRQGAAYGVVDGTSAKSYRDDYFTPEPRCVWYKMGDVDFGITIEGVMSVKGCWRYCYSYEWGSEVTHERWRPLEWVWRTMKWLLRMSSRNGQSAAKPMLPVPENYPAPKQEHLFLLPARVASAA